MCHKYKLTVFLLDTEVKLLPPDSFPDTLLVEKYGINGTICAEDWNEKAATVACKQLKYDGGVPFGPRYDHLIHLYGSIQSKKLKMS